MKVKATKDIERVRRFLKKKPHGKIWMAAYFRLTSTLSIDKWLSRGLPKDKRDQIMDYIKRSDS